MTPPCMTAEQLAIVLGEAQAAADRVVREICLSDASPSDVTHEAWHLVARCQVDLTRAAQVLWRPETINQSRAALQLACQALQLCHQLVKGVPPAAPLD